MAPAIEKAAHSGFVVSDRMRFHAHGVAMDFTFIDYMWLKLGVVAVLAFIGGLLGWLK